jgi:PAS domain-containing protein
MNRVLKIICTYLNPFHLHTPHLDKFVASIEDIKSDIISVRIALHQEKERLAAELEKKEAMLEAIMECVPDMLWCKDTDGKYLYANKAIREGLLFDDDPIGKIDTDLAKAAKKKFGEENHTFGEICGNSDIEILESGKPQRFLENGKVKGRNMELEVHKNIIKDKEGNIIGTVGTGRDITDYVEALDAANDCGGCKIVSVFEKHRFKG